VWGQLGEETVSSHAEGFSWPAHRARIRTHSGWGGRKVNGRTPRGCPRRIPSARCWGRRGRGLAASPGAWRPPDRPPGGGSPAGVVGGGHPHHLPPGRGPPAAGWPGSGPSPSRCRARVGGGGGWGVARSVGDASPSEWRGRYVAPPWHLHGTPPAAPSWNGYRCCPDPAADCPLTSGESLPPDPPCGRCPISLIHRGAVRRGLGPGAGADDSGGGVGADAAAGRAQRHRPRRRHRRGRARATAPGEAPTPQGEGETGL